MKDSTRRAVLLALLLPLTSGLARAQETVRGTYEQLAPGAPGRDAQWPSAGKAAVGTSATLESKVWFTLREGVMTEVYYPTVDVANSVELQFVVVPAGGGRVQTEADDATHRIEQTDPHSLTFRQTNTAKDGTWKLTKTYFTDPQRSTVLVSVEFDERTPHALYVYFDPALNNSGMHDTGAAPLFGDALLASDADKSSALVVAGPVALNERTNGYLGTSDALTQLRRAGRITNHYARAVDGNVVQAGRIVMGQAPRARFTLALGFGREPDEALANARASLKKGAALVLADYQLGWAQYLSTLRRVAAPYQQEFETAAMVLKAHEDKTSRGAMIASLSIPWGGGANANEPNVGGYHLVWSRDLYQVASAFYALGDKSAADRALDYLFRVQQKPDGSFPQNSWLDGRPFWGSLQLDEVAFPLILAEQLGRTDNETWTKHVRPAADFLIRTGPRTPQERWEEKPGYSPSTIAAEIAGLVCAAEIARRNDDQASAALYLAAADDWTRNIERWTATTTGRYGDGNYYLRLTDNDDPNDGAPFNVGNGGGDYDEREIVDAGFLELVRLGIKPADDPLIAKSVAVVNQVIRVETPNGECWYRYNHDGYGEMDDGRPWNFDGKYTGKGRLWALLAGERGEYELARGERDAAARRLDAMLGFANEGGMIPEQVWDRRESPRPEFRFGEGTGSATPLAWSMAQFIRLVVNLQEGRNLDTPALVAARYAHASVPGRAMTSLDAPAPAALERLEAGQTLTLRGRVRPGSRVYALAGTERRELSVDAQGAYTFEPRVEAGEQVFIIATQAPGGATSFERVRGLAAEEWRRASAAAEPAEFVERLKAAQASPLVEGDRAVFIYRGAARRVEVVGDFTGWRPAGLFMRDLPGTNLKYYAATFPRAARLEYKLIADGEWLLDPLNANRVNNGVGGENSVVAMPDYRAVAWLAQPAGAGGRVESLEVPSRLLGGARKVQVYLPRGYDAGATRYPVLYVQDGSDYRTRGGAVELADNLIGSGKLPPFIIVLIDPAERIREYWASDQFADFMARELVPFVDGRYRTRAERDARALLGASLGGVISVWTALRHPEAFARVGGQSSAFQIDDERVVAALAALRASDRSRYPLRFYFDVGRFEPILEVNRRVQVMLAGKGYAVTYRESEAGHNYTAWRDRLADAYTSLWSN